MVKKQEGRKKYECERCHKKFRKLSLCRDGKRRCGTCSRWYTNNKYYVPVTEKKYPDKSIGNFNLTDREKDLLHAQFVKQGFDSYRAWRKVYAHIKMLKAMKRRNRGLQAMQRRREILKRQEQEEQKEKFIEGLKNV
jgi:hypothetical protein